MRAGRWVAASAATWLELRGGGVSVCGRVHRICVLTSHAALFCIPFPHALPIPLAIPTVLDLLDLLSLPLRPSLSFCPLSVPLSLRPPLALRVLAPFCVVSCKGTSALYNTTEIVLTIAYPCLLRHRLRDRLLIGCCFVPLRPLPCLGLPDCFR